MQKRFRATTIVETPEGFLLTRTHHLHQVFHVSAQGMLRPSNEIVEWACYHVTMRDGVFSSSEAIIVVFSRQKAAY